MAKWSTTRSRMLAALTGAVLGLVTGGDAQAGGSEPPYLSDARLLAALPPQAILEVRLDADIDADGRADVAALGGTQHDRRVLVWFGTADGYSPPLSAPLGAPNSATGASLDHGNRDLVVYDATGGQVETKTIYRFRREPAGAGMRLTSIETERYRGRTAIRLAWDLLTGAHEFADGVLIASAGGEEAKPRYRNTQRSQRESPPVAMAQTPLPDALLDAELRAAATQRN